MFDPIIFDNIKVVLEGAVYDRDLEGRIVVTERADLVDLAAFNRLYRISFCLAEERQRPEAVRAQIELGTSLRDIAAEQLAQPLSEPIGCTIFVHFLLQLADPKRGTRRIAAVLDEVWGDRPHITQYIGTRLDEHREGPWPPERWDNKATLDFHRKIGEDNAVDLEQLVELCVVSLVRLREAGGES
ncbi:hypothetical protein [Brevibacillus marinus]|uniref:hypothetical protein n=1 Tax=Brevibacillus marinus TaxID=2496837 RepID=UPI000F847954|nr:hypothetical protein [Brevibacillus marinus]